MKSQSTLNPNVFELDMIYLGSWWLPQSDDVQLSQGNAKVSDPVSIIADCSTGGSPT